MISAHEIRLNHFQAMVIFALVVSVAFGFLSRRGAYQRGRYIFWSFILFLIIGVGIGWVMYPFSH